MNCKSTQLKSQDTKNTQQAQRRKKWPFWSLAKTARLNKTGLKHLKCQDKFHKRQNMF